MISPCKSHRLLYTLQRALSLPHTFAHAHSRPPHRSYLNEDFVGGEFFFVDGAGPVDGAEVGSEEVPVGGASRANKTVVQSTCGRLLAYSSGRENVHGVTGLREGR
jgi:hypothetical protein